MKNLLTSNIVFDDRLSYKRVILINSMMLIAIFIFILFFYLNVVYKKDYIIAILDISTAIFSVITLYDLRKNKNIKRAAKIATTIFALFIILFILDNKNDNFGLIWSIFIPLFAIQLNGKSLGIKFCAIYYLVLFFLAYQGIGTWNNGLWEWIDLVRFVISSSVLTYYLYVSESSHEEANNKLNLVRKHEKEILKDLKSMSVTDSLTGAYNRRFLSEIVPKILNSAKRQDLYISFFIVDIDYFKHYNDSYGHQAGDNVLKILADNIVKYVQRDDDVVFRLGGEEFAGIIQSKNIIDTTEWLKKLPKFIENLNIEHKTTRLDNKILTISMGIYSTNSKDTSLDDLYKNSDVALYKAKEDGRNKVLVFDEINL